MEVMEGWKGGRWVSDGGRVGIDGWIWMGDAAVLASSVASTSTPRSSTR